MIVKRKLRGALGATLPVTGTPLTPQSSPTESRENEVLVVVFVPPLVSSTTDARQVVVPVFNILTVTVALPPRSILGGTPE